MIRAFLGALVWIALVHPAFAEPYEEWVTGQLKRAEQLMEVGKGDDSRAILSEVLKKKDDARVRVLLARSYICFPPTDADQAMKILKPVVKSHPQYMEGLLEWARALRENHDYENALKSYDWVRQRFPKEPAGFYGKIEVYLIQKKFPEAEKAAQDAIQLDPKRAESYYYLGKVEDRRTDKPFGHSRAAAAYRQAIELSQDTRYYAALLFTEAIYLGAGYLETLTLLKQRFPQDAVVAFGEGLVADRTGRLAEALAKFQGATSVNWGLTFAHFGAGVLLSGQTVTTIVSSTPFPSGRLQAARPPVEPARALQEYAIVKFQDPTFPLMSIVDDCLAKDQEVALPQEPTAEQQANRKAFTNYIQLIRSRH
jgi:tetratricopeptide (TPR) repeat protein